MDDESQSNNSSDEISSSDSSSTTDSDRSSTSPSPSGQRPASTLAKTAQKAALKNLAQALTVESRAAAFTIAGTIPVFADPPRDASGNLTREIADKVQEQIILAKPITIRWGQHGAGRVLTLPLIDDSKQTILDELVQDCKPATFGLEGKDVYDAAYRKAGALAPGTDFVTDFCPYASGIIDIVTQCLVPAITGDLKIDSSFKHPTIGTVLQYEKKRDVDDSFNRCQSTRDGGYVEIADALECLERAGFDLEPDIDDLPQMLNEVDSKGFLSSDKESIDRYGVMELAEILIKRSENREMIAENKRKKKKLTKWTRIVQRRKMLSRGLRADLYKLNVYSGPGGRFRAHVDTPRSEWHVGSLVVSLPVAFEGGDLTVKHQGQTFTHKWSDSSSTHINWAAFYSDCTHEVLPVTSGHRVTLTYNLFLSKGSGLLCTRPSTLLPGQLPLVKSLAGLLSTRIFMPTGGYLGIRLAHSYPHTSKLLHDFMPFMLKGVDMVLYNAIANIVERGTGLKFVLVPVQSKTGFVPSKMLEVLNEEDDKDEGEEWRRSKFNSFMSGWTIHDGVDDVDDNSSDEDLGDYSDCTKVELLQKAKEDSWLREQLHKRTLRHVRDQITWLNRGGNKEMSLVKLAYGNDAWQEIRYSRAAMVIKIPSWMDRNVGDEVESEVHKSVAVETTAEDVVMTGDVAADV